MDQLTWTVHRAKESPVKTVMAGVFIAAFVVFSGWVFGPLLALLALMVFFLTLNTYFLADESFGKFNTLELVSFFYLTFSYGKLFLITKSKFL